MGADRVEYFMAPNPPPENRFHSNHICFYSNLGQVFPLTRVSGKIIFDAKLSGWFFTSQPKLSIISWLVRYLMPC